MLEIAACVLQPNCGEELLLKRLALVAALLGVFTLKEEQNQSTGDLTGFRKEFIYFFSPNSTSASHDQPAMCGKRGPWHP